MERGFLPFIAIILAITALIIDYIALNYEPTVFLLTLISLLFSIFAVSTAFSLGRRIKENKLTSLAVAGLVLGIIDVGIPYLFLKNIGKFWASYLFWTILSLIVVLAGIWRVSKWGER